MTQYTITITRAKMIQETDNVYDKKSEKWVDVLIDKKVNEQIYNQSIDIDEDFAQLPLMDVIKAFNGESKK